jgi:hypothetical protein
MTDWEKSLFYEILDGWRFKTQQDMSQLEHHGESTEVQKSSATIQQAPLSPETLSRRLPVTHEQIEELKFQYHLASEIETRIPTYRFRRFFGFVPYAVTEDITKLIGYPPPTVSNILKRQSWLITHTKLEHDLVFPPSGIFQFLAYKQHRKAAIKGGRPPAEGSIPPQLQAELLSLWAQFQQSN